MKMMHNKATVQAISNKKIKESTSNVQPGGDKNQRKCSICNTNVLSKRTFPCCIVTIVIMTVNFFSNICENCLTLKNTGTWYWQYRFYPVQSTVHPVPSSQACEN